MQWLRTDPSCSKLSVVDLSDESETKDAKLFSRLSSDDLGKRIREAFEKRVITKDLPSLKECVTGFDMSTKTEKGVTFKCPYCSQRVKIGVNKAGSPTFAHATEHMLDSKKGHYEPSKEMDDEDAKWVRKNTKRAIPPPSDSRTTKKGKAEEVKVKQEPPTPPPDSDDEQNAPMEGDSQDATQTDDPVAASEEDQKSAKVDAKKSVAGTKK